MNRSQTLVIVLATLCAAQGGWLAATWFGSTAWADDPLLMEIDGSATAVPFQLLCKTFAIDGPGASFTLPDSGSEAGQWAQSHPEMYPYTVDYEAVQKATGYPQHLVQVCLAPR